jgi:hypothetical protein
MEQVLWDLLTRIDQRDAMVRAQLATPPPFLGDVQVVHPCDRDVAGD